MLALLGKRAVLHDFCKQPPRLLHHPFWIHWCKGEWSDYSLNITNWSYAWRFQVQYRLYEESVSWSWFQDGGEAKAVLTLKSVFSSEANSLQVRVNSNSHRENLIWFAFKRWARRATSSAWSRSVKVSVPNVAPRNAPWDVRSMTQSIGRRNMMERLYSLAGHHNQSETSPRLPPRDARSSLCPCIGPWTCQPTWKECQDSSATAKVRYGLLTRRQCRGQCRRSTVVGRVLDVLAAEGWAKLCSPLLTSVE